MSLLDFYQPALPARFTASNSSRQIGSARLYRNGPKQPFLKGRYDNVIFLNSVRSAAAALVFDLSLCILTDTVGKPREVRIYFMVFAS